MSDRTGHDGPKTARQQIIEDAQIQCHIARSDFQQSTKLIDGDPPREIAMRLQQAVTDYYWALRPLRHKSVIKDFWKKTELSDHWTYTDQRTQPRVSANLYGQGVDVVEQVVDVDVPFKGLDHIERIENQYETETIVKCGARGRREETVRRKKLLDPEILLDISGVLDDAAAKLGFVPEVATEEITDEITDEDIEELFETPPAEAATDGGEPDGEM